MAWIDAACLLSSQGISALKEEGIKPKRKALEQAHMADHVLAQVSWVCPDFCIVA